MLPLVLSSQLVVVGVLFAFALLHFLIGIKHPERKLHFAFTMSSLAAMVEALTAGWRYHPASAADLVMASKFSGCAQFTFGICVVWFVAYYRGAKTFQAPWLITALWAAVVILHATLPYGLLFQVIPELHQIRLPWGELIMIPQGQPTRLLLVAHASSTSMAVYVVYSCWKMWREGQREKSLWLTAGYAPLVLVAWPHGLLVNRGVLTPPYLYSYTFIALIALMSFRMVKDTVNLANLAMAVEVHGLRWRMLLENIELMVVGCERNGMISYINPCFIRSTGFSKEELLSMHYSELLDEAERPTAAKEFDRILHGSPPEKPTLQVRRRDGSWRTILWTSVSQFDDQRVVTGILNIGFDITEKELAEKARDEAMRQLQELATRLEGENLYLREEIGMEGGIQTIVGRSPVIRYVVSQIKLVAKTKATVLIEGETGVGKELVARAVHELSDRAAHAFIGLNCAAMSPTLVEAELFGAEKGAYTGSDRQRKGRFEMADGGTLFLDEVGELPLDVQAKLLRVLQEGEIERLGGQQTRRVDVRIIAATNRNLHAEIAAGRFREDLYYRLGVYPISVPALRQRREDIPLLVEHLVSKTASRHGKSITEVPSYAMRLLTEWDWPGNVRELANVLERAVILSPGAVLSLPVDFGRPTSGTGPVKSADKFIPLAEAERRYVREVLDFTNWKIYGPGGAAEILDMHPNTLRSRMSKMGLKRNEPANQAAG